MADQPEWAWCPDGAEGAEGPFGSREEAISKPRSKRGRPSTSSPTSGACPTTPSGSASKAIGLSWAVNHGNSGEFPPHVLARMPAHQREAIEGANGDEWQTTESAVLGWAAAMFTAAIRGHGCPDVVSVEVMTWREEVLGQYAHQGANAAKQAAMWVANAYLRRHGLPHVADDHQAEALCIAQWRERMARRNALTLG